MEIIVPEENEKYSQYINRILFSRKNEKDINCYQEVHHIIPRCLAGNNDNDNLIYLYAQEHYYAHYLLFQENQNNSQLCHAWIMMAFKTKNEKMDRKYSISADEYALAKQLNAESTGNRFRGKKQNEESIRKRVQKTTGEGNGMYGKKGSLSPTYGLQRFGEENPFYGKKHTEESKKKMSNSKKGQGAGHKNFSARAVVCLNTQEVFLTIQEAASYGGTNRYGSNIVKCCKGTLQTCGKHPETGERLRWRYATEEERKIKKEQFNESVETAGLVQ